MKTSRLSFVRGSLGVCVAGVLTTACGGDDEDAAEGGSSCKAAVATNHGHSMTVSVADQMAGAAKTYDIQGSSAHHHTVALSAEHFADLDAGKVVVVTSSTDAGHSHDVTVTC
jgi:cytolysin (calcineurin-like family phosphatase)